ncbi:MAG: ubiquinol oxidase subunit II [Legionellales bacterium]|nr:ubiquinol oxidase subunit II [Legionellales bacterium]
MVKLRNIFFSTVALALPLLLSGCNAVVLNPKGVVAVDEKHLLITALLLMLTIVLPVIILTAVISRRYRASNKEAKYSPDWSHSYVLEAIWWGVPIIIISILATITWISTHHLDPHRPLVSDKKPLVIQVVALQWRWLFIYPEQNIATMNYVEFPTNVPVTFLITADAPMNSFQIPQLGGQIYAMAGMQTQLHLMANEPGIYEGRSVNFSGDGFTGMAFTATATPSEDEFNQWVTTVKSSGTPLTFDAYKQLAKPSEDVSVQNYSSAQNALFDNIIMKFMMPNTPLQDSPANLAPASSN